ncbi:hypothetical protein HF1_07760 [Mycoplasma haemofelis str. Langford 1]|uniref:Uncharacterized protein n=1 Tax=Mycoplasma haemofelis (strain Langford 1) TaxID=941640 RepID=E8ZI13_MYCHL|nr:hypothetical protein [Mycoplasma haemofelis]CBY92784.1 hypothetical protein HF1_07760 [Mycoplasma haemofelis str. Langford 1]
MELSNISEKLIAELDESVPRWRRWIDKLALDKAAREGILDEFWLLDYIRDANRARTYREINDRGLLIFRNLFVKLDKPLIEVFAQSGVRAARYLDELLEVEEKIATIIRKYKEEWKAKNDEEARRKIDALFSRAHEKIKERSNAYETYLNNISWKSKRVAHEYNPVKARKWRSMVMLHMDNFRQENERVYKSQQTILEKFKETLRENLGLNNSQERSLIDEIKDCLVKAAKNQRRLRREFVDSLIGLFTDGQDSSDFTHFISGFSGVSSESRDLLRLLVRSDFIASAFLAVASTQCFKQKVQDAFFKELEKLLDMAEERKEELRKTIDAVYNSDVYKFCNGGGVLTALAHFGTWGFCTGFTAAVNTIDHALHNVEVYRRLVVVIKNAMDIAGLPIGGGWVALATWAADFASDVVFGKTISAAICEFVEEMIADELEFIAGLLER